MFGIRFLMVASDGSYGIDIGPYSSQKEKEIALYRWKYRYEGARHRFAELLKDHGNGIVPNKVEDVGGTHRNGGPNSAALDIMLEVRRLNQIHALICHSKIKD